MSVRIPEEFRRQIESLLPYAAPVLVYPRINPRIDGWITGGTALLARTDTNRFLITADHFVSKINELRERSDIVVLLGGTDALPIDITRWTIIASDSFTDVCTIQMPQAFEANELNKCCFELDLAQSIRAAVGEQALILGFPASHRCASDNKINARVLPIMDYVTDVGVRRFTTRAKDKLRETATRLEDEVKNMFVKQATDAILQEDPAKLKAAMARVFQCDKAFGAFHTAASTRSQAVSSLEQISAGFSCWLPRKTAKSHFAIQ